MEIRVFMERWTALNKLQIIWNLYQATESAILFKLWNLYIEFILDIIRTAL